MDRTLPRLLVIFGVTGDLARRKLLPALVRLEAAGVLHDDFRVVGVTRSGLALDELRAQVEGFTDEPAEHLDALLRRVRIETADVTDASSYGQLAATLDRYEHELRTCLPRILYLSTPPSALAAALRTLGESGIDPCGHGTRGRVLIEKPFGSSMADAEQLAAIVEESFVPEEVFPIDHFLAKDTVQNVLHLRFRNPLLRHLWRAPYVSQIQITAAEDIDIQGRAQFFEETGILLDMVQSHLLQVLAITTMDEPRTMDEADVRENRARLLRDLEPIEGDEVTRRVVRAQYDGYRAEVDDPASVRETFVAMSLRIRNDRWAGVPVYLRTGKALAHGYTEVTLVFADTSVRGMAPNVLTLRLRPNEGVVLSLEAKRPGLEDEPEPISLDHCYRPGPGGVRHDAYDRVLVDAMSGDQTLFPSVPEALANWRFVDPVLARWEADADDLRTYPKGSSGPPEAEALLAADGHEWLPFDPAVCRIR